MRTLNVFGLALILLSTPAASSELRTWEAKAASRFPTPALKLSYVLKTASGLAASRISAQSKNEILGRYLDWAEQVSLMNRVPGSRIQDLRANLANGDYKIFQQRCKAAAEELEFLASKQ